MQETIETLAGDSAGVEYSIPVYRFEGSDPKAPSAYLQAALHAGELPGTVAIDVLMPLLRKADAEGRIRGRITVVPWANPVGRGQQLLGEVVGRFHLGTRTNFNRDFPLLTKADPTLLPREDGLETLDQRLKVRLLGLSLGHDIILDLHCDDEGVAYLYVPKVLWPAMSDCAAALNAEAVVLWDGPSGAAFEEAHTHPHLQPGADTAGKVVTTVEFRGINDVDEALARQDGEGLYRFLVARGLVEDAAMTKPAPFAGVAQPIENVEMVKAPKAGAILFAVKPGDRVEKGQRLATIVHRPGDPDGRIDVLAPQSGFVLTRRSHRQTRRNEDLVKLVGDQPSATSKPGVLEA
jgi:predicted deacylase